MVKKIAEKGLGLQDTPEGMRASWKCLKDAPDFIQGQGVSQYQQRLWVLIALSVLAFIFPLSFNGLIALFFPIKLCNPPLFLSAMLLPFPLILNSLLQANL